MYPQELFNIFALVDPSAQVQLSHFEITKKKLSSCDIQKLQLLFCDAEETDADNVSHDSTLLLRCCLDHVFREGFVKHLRTMI